MSNEILTKLASMESKLDRLDERLDSIERIQDKQEINLETHMRRSDALERQVGLVESRVSPLERSETRWALAAKIGVPFMAAVFMLLGYAKLAGFMP